MPNRNLSIVILARNEEAIIGRCLASLSGLADQVLVMVDDKTTDNTVTIANGFGADVVVQPWLGYPQQRNSGARLARHDWILMLDADEVVTDELRRSIRTTLTSNPDQRDGFVVDRRGEFMGAILPDMRRKGGGDVRLYNRVHSAYDESRTIHEKVTPSGATHRLGGLLIHYRPGGIDVMIDNNNKHATEEARLLDSKGVRPSWVRMVTKPVARFGWVYFASGTWRMGMRGFIYAVLKGYIDFMTEIKLWELHAEPVQPERNVERISLKGRGRAHL